MIIMYLYTINAYIHVWYIITLFIVHEQLLREKTAIYQPYEYIIQWEMYLILFWE